MVLAVQGRSGESACLAARPKSLRQDVSVAEPESLEVVLAGTTFEPLPASPDSFAAAWFAWDDALTPVQLPNGWRTRVAELVELGLGIRDLEECVGTARRATHVLPARRFVYAMAVGRRLAGEQHQAALSGHAPERVPIIADLGPYVRTPSGRVHRAGCRTLEHANPRNARAASSIVPFRPCRICL